MIDQNLDFFSLLQLPRCYDIDLTLLTERYYQLQKQVHPDYFVTASDQEKQAAAQASAYLNQAYTTLKSPLARAQYLLTLRGVAADKDATISHDADFLLQQWQLRERLAEIAEQDNSRAALVTLAEDVRQLIDNAYCALQEAFKAENDQAAADAVIKLQFFCKLEEQCQ